MATLLQWGLVNGILVTVLAVGISLFGRCVRRPALIHALWIVVLIKFVTPPIVALNVTIAWPARSLRPEPPKISVLEAPAGVSVPAEIASSAIPPSDGTGALSPRDPAVPARALLAVAWQRALASGFDAVDSLASFWRRNAGWISWGLGTLWMAGTLFWCARQFCLALCFQRRLAEATPAPALLVWHAERLARSMGLSRIPRIVMVPDAVSPMLCSIGSKTRLVLPQALLDRLNEEAGRTLLVHELAHYARGDHWVRLLELLATAVFWWHPVVWWARRQIEITEEECCDAWVVGELPSSSRTYAEALLTTIDFLAESPVAFPPVATGIAQVPFLRMRLTQIMRGVAPKSLSVPGRVAVLLLAVMLLPFHFTFSRTQAAGTARSRRKPDVNLSSRPPATPSTRENVRSTNAPSDQSTEQHPSSTASGSLHARKLLAGPAAPLQLAQGEPAVPSAAWAIAVSRDGRFQITRRGPGHVILYDSQRDLTTDLSDAHVLSVVFSPDSAQFASGGSDQLVRLWDSQTGKLISTFNEHADAIPALSFTPDGQWLISGSRDGDVRIWDVPRNDRARTLRLRQTPVESLSVSRDGRLVAIATDNRLGLSGGRVTIRDLATLSEKQSFPASTTIGAVAFHEDGISLVIGESNGRITFWNLLSGRPTAVGFVPKDVVASARFSVDTQALSRVDPNAILPVAPPAGDAPELPPIIRGVFGELLPADLERQHRNSGLPARDTDDATSSRG